MKLLLTLPFAIFSLWLAAQAPVNDDCAGIIDLGVAPYCSNPGQYTNVNATASNIDPQFNIPACFNNNAERDVWFQFTLPSDGSITDISIVVYGNIGGNGTLVMPEIALYRGDCSVGNLAELGCVAAPLNVSEAQLDFLNLDPGETYFIRINDYSATASPNWGTFKLCVQQFVPDFIMGEGPGAQTCSGTLWDSGGETDPYSSDENLTFTICPQEFHQCIQINVLEYFTENFFDQLSIYEGNGINGPLLAQYDGNGLNKLINVHTQGCATIAFQSDGGTEYDGFKLTWLCTPDVCPPDPPTPPSAANCDDALLINGCDQEVPNFITLAPGMGDPNFIQDGVNAGCIANPGADLNFVFFYFKAQADGDFSFLVKNGDPNDPSDIDFEVWGPIDNEEDICDFVTTHQPVRSSWTAAPSVENPEGYTGLTNLDPYSGSPITDDFDCGSPATPGQGILPTDDSFVKNLPVQEGKIYVVFLDDYSGAVESDSGLSIDFSGSTPGVLDPLPGGSVSITADTAICVGQVVQLQVTGGLDFAWSPGGTLSCLECPNPIAAPSETTTYSVDIATVCAMRHETVTVSIINLDLGPDANVCVGASFTLNDHPVDGDYLWAGSPGLDCTNCPSPTFTATEPGIFTLVCYLSTPFCNDTDIIKINVANGLQPQVSISPDTAICAGQQVSLGGPSQPGYQYNWTSTPSGFSQTVSNPSPVSPTINTTYYLNVVAPTCFYPYRDSVVVKVFHVPDLALISGASFCLGDSIALGTTVPETAVTYSWLPDDGSLSNIHAANPIATPTTPGLHNYTLTATNPGCAVVQTVPVFVVDLQLNLNVEDSIFICKGTSIPIAASVFPSANSVLWSPLDGLQLTPDGHNAIATPDDNVTYTATVSVPGCQRTKKVFVKVDSLPQFLNISPMDTSVCLGAIVLLKNPTGDPLYEPANFPEMTFLWTPGDGQLTADTLPFMYVSPMDTIVYHRVAQNGACLDTVVVTVNVLVPPQITITPLQDTICLGQTIQFSATAPGIDSLLWTPSNTLSCDDCLNPIATPIVTTTYNLSGKYHGCPVGALAFATVTQPPQYQFPNANWCNGDEILLNFVTDPSVTSYQWSSNPPSVIQQVAQPTVTAQSTGIQHVTYYLDASNGCAIHDSVTLQITGANLDISAPDTICPGIDKLLNIASSVGGGVYMWSTGSANQAIYVHPDSTTTYYVSYLLNGCSFEDSVLITVQGESPDIQFPTDAALCPGDSIFLNSASTPNATYQWTSDPPGFTSNEAMPPAFPVGQTTEFTVMATLGECTITKKIPVTVFNATLTVTEDQEICAGTPFTLMATGSATGTYQWSTNETTPSIKDTLEDAQIAHYGVLYTYGPQGNECHLADTISVEVLSSFKVKIVADPDTAINAGASSLLDAVVQPSQNVNGFTFEWYENGTKLVGNTQKVTVTPSTTDTTVFYTVIVTSPNGCSQTEIVEFRVLQPVVKIPNAFTPNGDEANDSFGLVVVEGIAKLQSMEIYDRWGQRVFYTTEENGRWDGKIDGKPAPSDVYIYKIRWRRNDGSLVPASGEVTLLR